MAKKYMSDIHLEEYAAEYEEKKALYKDMVFTGGRDALSLNGAWNYAVDQYDTCLRQKWFKERYQDERGFTLPVDYSFDEWPVMELPRCWNVFAAEYLLYEGAMVFTRRFAYDTTQGGRCILRIGAASMLCRVFLNGTYIGMHRGASTPFFFDVTDLVEEDNRILLCVDSTRRPEQVPTENTDWFNYGGVFRDIELLRVPAVYIKSFHVSLVPDGKFDKLSVKICLSEQEDGNAKFQLRELGIAEEIPVKNGTGEIAIDAKPRLWSPEDPYLYDVSAEYSDDRVSDRVGFREIRVCGRDILLNGKSIFLKGISAHEESVANGRALTDEERMENIRLAKELGCNFMRIAHYPHHERMAKMADELGIMLWEEIPVYWAIRFDRKETYEDAQNQLAELIERDYNRASVIIWSVGNENADTDSRLSFMKRLADHAHHTDITRPVSAACLVDEAENKIADRLADSLDIIGINEYCGWYSPDFERLPALLQNSDPEKPVIITEFGADAMRGNQGDPEKKGTEEYQAAVYERQMDTLLKIGYIKGISPWILYDFRCPRRTSSIQKYYNRKGLLDETKTYRKPAFYVLQKYYRRISSC
ncbi:MAG: glycoside hydrolase family 2 [Lachnospiraceae bacterium]|nr:glycoside hydrolase family 2 [Lachnospiraceae bacterium]